MENEIRTLIVLAFVGLFILLRFDAIRFGAAEYDDENAPGGWRNGIRRLTWYALGLVLVLAIFQIHPSPETTLFLRLAEDRGLAITAGIAFGVLGTAIAVAFAQYRYGRLRLPDSRYYPGAIANSLGTAFIDEAAFRGALFGVLLVTGLPVELAIMAQAVVYGLATRLGVKGRSLAMLGITLGLGVIAAWLTYASGGIGAAFIGHAIARFAIFVCTGHAGQVLSARYAPIEDEEEYVRAPDAWEVVREFRR